MKKAVGLFIILSLLLVNVGFSAERGTLADAEAMVKKAVAYLKANGRDKGLAEISNPKGQFIDRDIYVFADDINGKCIAHGQNQKMIGKDNYDLTDASGKLFVKERINIAKTKGKGTHTYKFQNPLTKKLEEKTVYFEKFEDFVVGSGAYQ